jgi:epoxyqueuosine reductase
LQTPQQTTRVLDCCRELGFALAGVAVAEPTAYERELIEWLEQGRHGEMQYLARNVALRADPRKMVPGAQSIICVADRHHDAASSGTPKEEDPHPSPPPQAGEGMDSARGRIARYARGDDYHVVIRKRLHVLCDELAAMFPQETFRACVDTAPVLEREHAQRAGLGAVGKHTLLIEPGVGSYLLLGEVITTLALEPSSPHEPDPCGTCTRCIDACPTDAITPWSVDATRCISYLTIEHRGAIDERYHEPMGAWIFGCDICQEVCPHNQPTERRCSAPVHEAYATRRDGFDLLEVLDWDEQSRRDAFVRSAMKRAKLPMMKRNVLIAAGNALARRDDQILRLRVESIAQDASEADMVRATARSVLRRLKGS